MFSFRQFTIHQDRTAMKVCTDACVLGAYADLGQATGTTQSRILDIGTGTGLLALMAAQRNPSAIVDAIEIDSDAAQQATENANASPFASRVRIIHGPIQDYSPGLVYDRILTNPPFFVNHLRSPNPAVNRALHTDALSFSDLVAAVSRLLHSAGQWWVLLPPYETELLTTLARQAALTPFHQLHLRHNEIKPPFRVITGFSRQPSTFVTDTLTIYEPNASVYTPAFRSLLQYFYLTV